MTKSGQVLSTSIVVVVVVGLAAAGSWAQHRHIQRQAAEKRLQTFREQEAHSEVETNLKKLFVDEKEYFQAHDRWSPDFSTIGFNPKRGNLYSYFLAVSGPTDLRTTGKDDAPPHVVVISADRWDVVDSVDVYARHDAPTDLRLAGCPTRLRAYNHSKHLPDKVETLKVGVSGSGGPASRSFVAVAVGNLDQDPTLDCWSISSADRVGPNDYENPGPIPAGMPWMDQDDVDE